MSHSDTAGATATEKAVIGVWAVEEATLAWAHHSLNAFAGI